MAKNTDITTGVQAVSATGAVTGSLDTSALVGDYTVFIEVLGLTAGKTAIVAIEDTANVTPFSDAIQVWVEHFVGGLASANDVGVSRRKYQMPGTRFGVANSKLRANALSITATPGLSIHVWLAQ